MTLGRLITGDGNEQRMRIIENRPQGAAIVFNAAELAAFKDELVAVERIVDRTASSFLRSTPMCEGSVTFHCWPRSQAACWVDTGDSVAVLLPRRPPADITV